MLSQDDSDQLILAVSEQRAIVTFNASDFVRLHEQYIIQRVRNIGALSSPLRNQ